MRAAASKYTLTSNVSSNGRSFKAEQDFAVMMTANGDTGVTGTAKLQYSLDPIITVPDNVANWVDLPGASVAVSGTAAAGFSGGKIEFAANWLRLVYTASSGTGQVYIYVKTNGI